MNERYYAKRNSIQGYELSRARLQLNNSEQIDIQNLDYVFSRRKCYIVLVVLEICIDMKIEDINGIRDVLDEFTKTNSWKNFNDLFSKSKKNTIKDFE